VKEPKITRIVVDENVADQELVQRYQRNNPDAINPLLKSIQSISYSKMSIIIP